MQAIPGLDLRHFEAECKPLGIFAALAEPRAAFGRVWGQGSTAHELGEAALGPQLIGAVAAGGVQGVILLASDGAGVGVHGAP
jgi:hypothetical protein